MRGVVSVVGAGNVGTSWAGLFAAHGYAVRLFDVRSDAVEKGLDRAATAARFLVAKGLVSPELAEGGLVSLTGAATLEAAVAGCCLVQECVLEDLPTKRAIFAEAGRFAPPQALIATSSSGLSITAIQQGVSLPERTLAAHPYNPPHLVPLVELAPGALTSTATMAAAREFYAGVGKEPVVMHDDVPGYIANRLSAALWREAIELVRRGVASVEDVDRAVSLGPGLRWAVMGPHLTYHLGGGSAGIRGHMAHLRATKETILRDLASWTSFPPDTVDVLAAGVEAEAAGQTPEILETRRDEALAAIVKALRAVPDSPSETLPPI